MPMPPQSPPSGRQAPPGGRVVPGHRASPARQEVTPARRRAIPGRPAARALLLLAAVAAMLGLPAAAPAAVLPAHATTAAHLTAAAHPAAAPATASAEVTAKPNPGGICQVPGIGDVGGLLGFCAQGSSGIIGALNNVCQPSVPTPEPASGGIDALIKPPAGTGGTGKPTLYDNYGMAGQSWAAFDLQCSDMASLVGNNIAGVVFDAAKALDRVTITIYQSAAGNGILS